MSIIGDNYIHIPAMVIDCQLKHIQLYSKTTGRAGAYKIERPNHNTLRCLFRGSNTGKQRTITIIYISAVVVL